jgi:bacterial/archaeal transporter family-2 protein
LHAAYGSSFATALAVNANDLSQSLALLDRRRGAATVIALIVAGQMIGSLAFDQFGLLGVPVHPLNMFRLAGAALLVLGAILVRL